MFRLGLLVLSAVGVARGEVSFNFEVRPILSKNCIACHGPDEGDRRGDLRLDTFEGATAELEGRAAVVPHQPEKSTLLERVMTADPDDLMPPPDHGERLTGEQVGVLRQWIAEGAKYETHWAFVPPVRAEVPEMGGRAANAIDAFVFRKLEGSGLSPSPPAEGAELIRRMALDLTGLPPTRVESEDFVKAYGEDADAAVSAAADRLLASPAYGEHWAAMWMDLARYADTVGYAGDEHRDIWPWRDWVIKAFNENKPYDRFLIEQVAGDLLPGATVDQKLATAFHRLTMSNNEGGTNDEEFRTIAVKDRVSTTVNTFMGLSMRCAECHTHKYDPISHNEYYEFYAFFNQSADRDQPNDEPRIAVMPAGQRGEAKEIRVPVMEELEEDSRRKTHLMTRGSFLQPAEEVSAGVPEAFGKLPEGSPVNRMGVAQWMLAEENPLTARVAVNRYWARLFGLGIVETEEDFGIQGMLPTHSELLDWLAVEFRESGWDTKRLLKLMVESATYRQSAMVDSERLEKDPRNLLLSRGPRYRLPAEVIRDQALAVSGLLTRDLYGPPVYPPSPIKRFANAFKGDTIWKESQGPDRYRRAIYTYLKRSNPHPLFETFDMASRDVCVMRRLRTNTPLQSFMTLNDVVFVEASQGLARKMAGGADGAEERIRFGLREVLLREPSAEQVEGLLELYVATLADYQGDPEAALKMAGTVPTPAAKDEAAELAALTVAANVMLNLDGFLCK